MGGLSSKKHASNEDVPTQHVLNKYQGRFGWLGGGDKFLKELEEDSVDADILKEELQVLNASDPNTCRRKTEKVLEGSPMQILLCVLVVLDVGIVIAEILLDLRALRAEAVGTTQRLVLATDFIQARFTDEMCHYNGYDVGNMIDCLNTRFPNGSNHGNASLSHPYHTDHVGFITTTSATVIGKLTQPDHRRRRREILHGVRRVDQPAILSQLDSVETVELCRRVLSVQPDDIDDRRHKDAGFPSSTTKPEAMPRESSLGTGGWTRLLMGLYSRYRSVEYMRRVDGIKVVTNIHSPTEPPSDPTEPPSDIGEEVKTQKWAENLLSDGTSYRDGKHRLTPLRTKRAAAKPPVQQTGGHGDATASTDHGGEHSGRHGDPYVAKLHKISHGLHYASIAILAVFVIQVFLKIFASGAHFFQDKLEVFDAFVIFASFALDIAFMDGVTDASEDQASTFILIFLLWRILRIVNGLVLANQKRQEFRIKLLKRVRSSLEQKSENLRDEVAWFEKLEGNLKKLCLQKGASEDEMLMCKPPKLAGTQTSSPTYNGLSQIASLSMGLSMSMTSGANNNTNSDKKPAAKRNLPTMSSIPETSRCGCFEGGIFAPLLNRCSCCRKSSSSSSSSKTRPRSGAYAGLSRV